MLENLPDALGHALRDQRAGLDQIAFQRIDLRNGMGALDLESLAFVDHGPLPSPTPPTEMACRRRCPGAACRRAPPRCC